MKGDDSVLPFLAETMFSPNAENQDYYRVACLFVQTLSSDYDFWRSPPPTLGWGGLLPDEHYVLQ